MTFEQFLKADGKQDSVCNMDNINPDHVDNTYDRIPDIKDRPKDIALADHNVFLTSSSNDEYLRPIDVRRNYCNSNINKIPDEYISSKIMN